MDKIFAKVDIQQKHLAHGPVCGKDSNPDQIAESHMHLENADSDEQLKIFRLQS